jgi:DNA-binding transcriptional ArsR family regulator
MVALELETRDRKLAETFKALGNPVRLKILRVLASRGTCICSEVVEDLPLAQSTVSQHLKVLKEAGLIVGNVEGASVCYCIAPGAVEELGRSVSELVGELESAQACCDISEGKCC